MPSRRTVLAAAVPLVTGCLSGSPASDSDTATDEPETPTTDSDAPEDYPTRRDWGKGATVEGTTVTPRSAWVQQSTLALQSADQMTVEGFGDRQVLFVAVDATDDRPLPAPESFWATVGEHRADGRTDLEAAAGTRVATDETGYGSNYSVDDPTGWVAFPLPDAVSRSTGALYVQFGGDAVGQVQWPLPADTVSALTAAPPAFGAVSIETPDAVGPEEPFEVSVSVENSGGPGTFRAAVNEAGPRYRPHRLRVPVGSGGSASGSVTIDSHLDNDTDEVRLRVVTTGGSTLRTVAVER